MRTPEPNPSTESGNTPPKRELVSLEEYERRKYIFSIRIAIASNKAAKEKYERWLARVRAEWDKYFENIKKGLASDESP